MYNNLNEFYKEIFRNYEEYREENYSLVKLGWLTESQLISEYLERQLMDIEEKIDVIENMLIEEYDKEENDDESDRYYEMEKLGEKC